MTKWLFGGAAVVAAVFMAAFLRGGDVDAAEGWVHADDARIAYEPDAGEWVLEVGPVDLHADGSVRQPAASRLPMPASGWLRGYSIEIEDAHGAAVPQAVLHHINLMTPQRRELFSPIMQRFGAAGAETAPVRLPRMLGYRVERDDTLLVATMLHNPTARDWHGVRVRVRLAFVPASAAVRPLSVEPFYMDVTPPAGVHAYDLPPGRSVQSWSGRPAVPGRVLGVGGHVHRNAVALRFEDVTSGELLWEARPMFDENGDVESVPARTFLRTLGLPLDTARWYRLSAVYDNPTGETIPGGAMGTLGGIFLPARHAQWPAADPADPIYRRDVSVVTGDHRAAPSSHDHAHHR